MADLENEPAALSAWMKRTREARGWSTTKLANIAREIARREGSSTKLTQQTVSGFETKTPKRVPEWIRYVRMAFQEGEPAAQRDTERRDELVYVRQIDISYGMGAGTNIEEFADASLVPFNLNFLQRLTRAPLERLFIATGQGDSMEPTVHKHDLVLIDTTETRMELGDTIWALEYAGSGLIKRLRRVVRNGTRKVVILSDNPSVPPEEADPEEVRVVGRVIWIARQMA